MRPVLIKKNKKKIPNLVLFRTFLLKIKQLKGYLAV